MQKKQSPQTIENKEGQVKETTKTCSKCENSNVSFEKLTKIDNFKDVKISEFLCKQCGYEERQVDFVERKNDFGIEILYQVQHSVDGQRQVIHSQTAKILIEQLDLNLSNTEKPKITTIKGLVERAVEQLKTKLNNNQEQNLQIKSNIQKAQKLLQGGLFPLTIRIRDPSGNSNVKNLNFPLPDKNIQIYYFERTVEELMAIGFTQQQAEKQVKIAEERKKGIKLNFNKPFEEKDFMHKEPVIFQVPCHTCMMPGQMKLCETSVPYFTDLVIMSFTCEYCGAHSVETKNGGQVHDEALQIILKVDTVADLKRDLFKSETCKVCIQQLELQLDYGTLGGQYTTVQGLLEKVYDHLSGRNHFIDLDNQFSVRMAEFLGDLIKMKDGQKPFTLHLIDPLSRSFLQNPFHPQEDHKAKRVVRVRNEEQDDFLGFSGMNVDNYN